MSGAAAGWQRFSSTVRLRAYLQCSGCQALTKTPGLLAWRHRASVKEATWTVCCPKCYPASMGRATDSRFWRGNTTVKRPRPPSRPEED